MQRVALHGPPLGAAFIGNNLDINVLRRFRPLVRWVHSPSCLRAGGEDRGCTVTTLFENVVQSTDIQAAPVSTPKKKHSWLPILTVLFMISYGLMTMLIVEQGQTIESQRALIRELFRDSTELSAVKMKALQDARSHAAQAAVPQNPSASTHAPSTQAPSTQAKNQTPSSQAAPQQRAQLQTKPKSQFQMPSKPASDLQDNRRALITI